MSDRAKIPLVEGGFAMVDEASYDALRHFIWHRCGFCQHVYRTVPRHKDGSYIIYMAAEVAGDGKLPVSGACNDCPAVPDLKKKR